MDSSYCLSVEIGVICGKFRRMPGAAGSDSKTVRRPQIRLIYFIYLLFIIYLCAGLHVGGLEFRSHRKLSNSVLRILKHVGIHVGDSEAPNDGNRGSGRVRTRLGFTPAERALPCSGHCDFLRRNAALCITFLHRCLSMLNFVIPFGKERYT